MPTLDPARLMSIGAKLRPLRDEGVLIIGSGNLTHNLRDMIFGVTERSPRIPRYVLAFQDWMHDRVMARDVEALIDYRRRAPGAARAHPSEEHLFPLHVVLGAAGSASVPTRTFAGITEGALAMDVYTFADA
jgi:4,5-DOPA dioxygenase extradiol